MIFGRIHLTMNWRGFVAAVRDLLVPLLADIQRFGLKAHHLRKHRSRADRFYRDMITGQPSVRDTTARYRKRFERYKDSMFSFIENDGVPWHNNAAERALRHLAVQRNISGAFSEKGRVTTSVSLLSHKLAASSENRFLGSCYRNLRTSTNTETGAEYIRTGLPTPREKCRID
jgi:Transposase IS66 family